MKHLFYIGSHLHFYEMNQIRQEWNINPDDCILLLFRGYHIPKGYDTIYLNQIPTEYNVSPTKGRIFKGLRFWLTAKNIQNFDNIINNSVGNSEFIWFTAHCSNDLCSLVVTNSKCTGYYIIEEGAHSYRNFNPALFTGTRTIIYKLLLQTLWPRIYSLKHHFITTDHPKFKGLIATNQRCFPLHQDKLQIIGSPWEKIFLTPQPDAVLSIDTTYFKEEWSTIVEVYKTLAQHFRKKQYKSVFYKYHPLYEAKANIAIYNQMANLIKQQFVGVNMILLHSDVVLENVCFTYHCDFYSDASSVGIYAFECGCKVYSYYPLLHNFKIEEQVPFFKDYVIPISGTN